MTETRHMFRETYIKVSENLYVEADRFLPYLEENGKVTDIVTFYIPSLRFLYGKNREMLSPDDNIEVTTLIREGLKKPEDEDENDFFVFRDLSEFDTIDCSYGKLIRAWNSLEPIKFWLPKISQTLVLEIDRTDV